MEYVFARAHTLLTEETGGGSGQSEERKDQVEGALSATLKL